ncbi:MAG: hypothetical protein H6662_03775 [Ardenticatenaceae bacterium]|nr:hypothetical protein [Anaerolineales bacterium]MCB8920682.1 hypothetical protein [Ardenticatenaceae bacterium]
MLLLVLLPIVLWHPAGAEPSAPPSNAPDWSVPISASLGDHSDKVPHIIASPYDDQVLIVYTSRTTDEAFSTDPWYALSTDRGETWEFGGSSLPSPVPQPIHTSASVESLQVNAAFDPSGEAHAVWIEEYSLFYADQDRWPTGGATLPTVVSPVASAPGASDPVIEASSTQVLDVIWSEGSTGIPPDLKHARSLDGGASWSTVRSNISTSEFADEFPSLVVDSNNSNRLHVVWQITEGSAGSIYYAQGTVSGSVVAWSTPIQISADASNDRQPKIVLSGSQLVVSYSHVEPIDVGGEIVNYQLAYYTACSGNCTQASSWRNPENISGQFVTVNETSPFYITTAIVSVYGCKYVYYHGVVESYVNESVLGVNSCVGWSGGGVERITEPGGVWALNPSVAAHADGWVYLVYEQVDSSTPPDSHQVYFMRGEVPLPGLYLPVVLK